MWSAGSERSRAASQQALSGCGADQYLEGVPPNAPTVLADPPVNTRSSSPDKISSPPGEPCISREQNVPSLAVVAIAAISRNCRSPARGRTERRKLARDDRGRSLPRPCGPKNSTCRAIPSAFAASMKMLDSRRRFLADDSSSVGDAACSRSSLLRSGVVRLPYRSARPAYPCSRPSRSGPAVRGRCDPASRLGRSLCSRRLVRAKIHAPRHRPLPIHPTVRATMLVGSAARSRAWCDRQRD